MGRAIWLGHGAVGDVVDVDDARVSPLDHGLLVGDGVFETLRVYGGVPFAWSRHDARLRRSADGLGLAVPDEATLRRAADAVLAANGLREARLRITVTGGEGPPGSDRGDAAPTVLVVAVPVDPAPASVAVVTVPWTRNEHSAIAGLKTISYADNVRALAVAKAAGASEALLANTRGELCEATGSNVFLVDADGVRTPPESAGCLAGVTRALVIELCDELGIPLHLDPIPFAGLAEATEMFLSSSTREVQPVHAIDARALPIVGGPLTRRIAGAFRALVARNRDP